ncbi:uncharacterized protein LOC144294096 [Canis aureus]
MASSPGARHSDTHHVGGVRREGRRPARPCACVDGRPAPAPDEPPTSAPIGWGRTCVRARMLAGKTRRSRSAAASQGLAGSLAPGVPPGWGGACRLLGLQGEEERTAVPFDLFVQLCPLFLEYDPTRPEERQHVLEEASKDPTPTNSQAVLRLLRSSIGMGT